MLLKIENDRRLIPADREASQLVNRHELGDVIECEIVKEKEIGSMNMSNLWRVWMRETAKHMHEQGCTMPLYIDSQGKAHGSRPFDENDAHDLFTMKWLGSIDGRRLSWTRTKDPEKVMADKGQRFHAMEKHEAWATDRGINLTVPIKSEYRELMERMSES